MSWNWISATSLMLPNPQIHAVVKSRDTQISLASQNLMN